MLFCLLKETHMHAKCNEGGFQLVLPNVQGNTCRILCSNKNTNIFTRPITHLNYSAARKDTFKYYC